MMPYDPLLEQTETLLNCMQMELDTLDANESNPVDVRKDVIKLGEIVRELILREKTR
jgi:hypothetical protein